MSGAFPQVRIIDQTFAMQSAAEQSTSGGLKRLRICPWLTKTNNSCLRVESIDTQNLGLHFLFK